MVLIKSRERYAIFGESPDVYVLPFTADGHCSWGLRHAVHRQWPMLESIYQHGLHEARLDKSPIGWATYATLKAKGGRIYRFVLTTLQFDRFHAVHMQDISAALNGAVNMVTWLQTAFETELNKPLHVCVPAMCGGMEGLCGSPDAPPWEQVRDLHHDYFETLEDVLVTIFLKDHP